MINNIMIFCIGLVTLCTITTSEIKAAFYREAELHCPKKLPTKTHLATTTDIFLDVLFTGIGMAIPNQGLILNTLIGKGTGELKSSVDKSSNIVIPEFKGNKVRRCEITFHTENGKKKRTLNPGNKATLKFAKYQYSHNKMPKKIQIKINVKGGKDLHFSAEAPNLKKPQNKAWFQYRIHKNGKGGLGNKAQKVVNAIVRYLETPIYVKHIKFHCPNRGRLRNCRLEYFNQNGKVAKTKIHKNQAKVVAVSTVHGFKYNVDLKNWKDPIITWRDGRGLKRYNSTRVWGCNGWGKDKRRKCLGFNRYVQIPGANIQRGLVRREIIVAEKSIIALASIQGVPDNKIINDNRHITKNDIKKWKEQFVAGGINNLNN